MNYEHFFSQMAEISFQYGLKIIYALIILVLGRWLAKILRYFLLKVMKKSNLDDMLMSFMGSIVYIGLMAFVIIASLNQLGLQTTSFIAVLGAAGLAIGLALQGSLSNFAAGALMVMFRSFKTGDFIECAGVSGTVEEIQIFSTCLTTPDNKRITVPNAKILSNNIVNYSSNPTRRVDMVIGVGYQDDLNQVKNVVQDILAEDTRILKEPAAVVAVLELADNSVNLAIRPWVKTADYWSVYFNLLETFKNRFEQDSISIPYPQRDIHVFQHTTA